MTAQLNLGKLITGEAFRDAIHIAVAPVEAATDLEPGQHVSLNGAGKADLTGDPIGIVDPFLPQNTYINRGDKFYLYLYPNSIVSLRHHWAHPAFAGDGPIVEQDSSKRWLIDFASGYNMTYDQIIDNAHDAISDGYLTVYDDAAGQVDPEFWDHYERATGKTVPLGVKGETRYNCSC